MKKLFLFLFACFSLCMRVDAQINAIDDNGYEEVALSCCVFDQITNNKGGHRTPPQIPTVYFSHCVNMLLFSEPVGDCIIELVYKVKVLYPIDLIGGSCKYDV